MNSLIKKITATDKWIILGVTIVLFCMAGLFGLRFDEKTPLSVIKLKEIINENSCLVINKDKKIINDNEKKEIQLYSIKYYGEKRLFSYYIYIWEYKENIGDIIYKEVKNNNIFSCTITVSQKKNKQD